MQHCEFQVILAFNKSSIEPSARWQSKEEKQAPKVWYEIKSEREKSDGGKGESFSNLLLHPLNVTRGTGLPSACHSGGDWGGGVGGRGEEGSQCWPGRGCPGCVAPSPASPVPLDPRKDGCSAAGSSSSIAGCCHCLCSPRTSQLYPWKESSLS